ncbi:hypothetical protein EXIGLDRAFT_654400 [Exidia glandulosa HHB12029]|uniref:Macrofage activating glyco protein n=1 Tax=Exidia glandulosa HHB12029 TaxID=1314781 RepID=A0A165DQ04_EXIGL|nr:hypothetical protein EXIGLDRAFT_654400 [Exidia glandulosa HHB12029]
MSRFILFSTLIAAALAQPDGPNDPLNNPPDDTSNPMMRGKAFPYNKLPYQSDTSPEQGDWRGPQSGYNQCNATTEGQNSMCQTLIVNSIEDFCVWGPPNPNTLVGDAEGEMVIWCTKPGRGGRVIPSGALTGVQFIRTPSYVEVTGHIDQKMINIKDGDEGGELDSGGQDNRGNPIGALVYSNSMPSSHGQLTQSRTWHAFMGSNIFCQKLCDPKAPNARGLCRHELDEAGCDVNVPAAYRDNVFESCLGDDQASPQIGKTDIPASSSCTTYASTELYGAGAAAPTGTAVPGDSAPQQTAAPAPPTGGSGAPPAPPTGGSGAPPAPPTGGSGAPSAPPTGGSGAPPAPPTGGSGTPAPPTGGSGAPPTGGSTGGSNSPGGTAGDKTPSAPGSSSSSGSSSSTSSSGASDPSKAQDNTGPTAGNAAVGVAHGSVAASLFAVGCAAAMILL